MGLLHAGRVQTKLDILAITVGQWDAHYKSWNFQMDSRTNELIKHSSFNDVQRHRAALAV